MEQLCPKCATGTCQYRNGIMCRAHVCARDEKAPFDFDSLFSARAALQNKPAQKVQLCPKCATGTCPFRNGIYCRSTICARDDHHNNDSNFSAIKDLFGDAGMGFFK